MLDCEGSELTILWEMDIRPRIVIVETHASYDAPTAAARRVLQGLGYGIVSIANHDPHSDVAVVVATKNGNLSD